MARQRLLSIFIPIKTAGSIPRKEFSRRKSLILLPLISASPKSVPKHRGRFSLHIFEHLRENPVIPKAHFPGNLRDTFPGCGKKCFGFIHAQLCQVIVIPHSQLVLKELADIGRIQMKFPGDALERNILGKMPGKLGGKLKYQLVPVLLHIPALALNQPQLDILDNLSKLAKVHRL